MRRTVRIAAGIAAAATIAFVAGNCGDSTSPGVRQWVANLNAAAEGPNHTSPGSGVFTFVDNGNEIDWTLELTNMTAVTASHIHLGSSAAIGTAAGPVIINLFLPNGASGALNGVVAQGTITNANNVNYSLDALRALFDDGNAVYANVHTSANPTGEIRDQVHRVP